MKFNADEVPAQPPRETGPMPDGTYRVRVEQSTELNNKSGTGRYLELVLAVTDGPYRGRKLWARYTTEHQSQKAQEIGLGQISEASRALGRPSWQHEVELEGLVGEVRVGRQKDNHERNEVKGWIVPEQHKSSPTQTRPKVDVNARNGQLAEVTQANAGRQAAPDAGTFFDEDVPF